MSEDNEVDHQTLQPMLTEGCADWQGFGQQIALEANALLGGQDSVLIFDESGFAKKGEASAGVARQWNGRLGKVDNCQVGVFATLCRGDMATLIDSRLYLPEAWCQDDTRCRKAAIPEAERQFRSKSQLALAMLKAAQERGIQFGYVGINGGYGKDPAFLRSVDAQGCRFIPIGHKWRMCIVIKRSICRILISKCLKDPDTTGNPVAANLTALHSVLTAGPQRSHRKLGSV